MATKKKALKKPRKKKRGGARKGAGRPATGKVVTKTKYVRCSDVQAEALDDHMEAVNSDRAAKGLKNVSFSKWAVEALLVQAGREDLTDAGNPLV